MTRLEKLIEKLDNFIYEAAGFKVKTLLNKLDSTDRDIRRVDKKIGKDFPELKYKDPDKNHVAYKEFKASRDKYIDDI